MNSTSAIIYAAASTDEKTGFSSYASEFYPGSARPQGFSGITRPQTAGNSKAVALADVVQFCLQNCFGRSSRIVLPTAKDVTALQEQIAKLHGLHQLQVLLKVANVEFSDPADKLEKAKSAEIQAASARVLKRFLDDEAEKVQRQKAIETAAAKALEQKRLEIERKESARAAARVEQQIFNERVARERDERTATERAQSKFEADVRSALVGGAR